MVILNYLGEIWKDILGFENKYQASNFGRIKSLNYHREGREEILKQHKTNRGYLHVILCKNGKSKWYFVHRLVWSAFNGEIPEGMQINHKDEDKSNNRLDNLELVTRKENINWGTRNKKVSQVKTNGKTSKAVLQYTLEGELIKEFPSTKEIERQLGYNCSGISYCCTGKYKQAYGYIWRYKN